MTSGPDGKTYPTWHPQVDPTYQCYFDHEHGDDPRTSNANNALPPFGYIGTQVGDSEPHNGFKVFVANRGMQNDEGRTNQADSRIVFHMGTGGPKRFDTPFHSLMYDVVAPNGWYMHVQAMANTGSVGSICANPRQGRTVLARGCTVDSAYEIWQEQLTVLDTTGNMRASAIVSTGVFDPITVMEPSNHQVPIYIWDPLAQSIFRFADNRSGYRGCNRESYHGPVTWYNPSGTTNFMTDGYGREVAGGTLRQSISNGNGNFPMTNDGQTQFKFRKSQCAAGLGIAN
jgi:hypothetical protein